MYAAAMRLRYSQPDIKRPFKIPGGNVGMWVVGIVGLLGALIAGVISFVPPNQIKTGSPAIYVGLLLVGAVIFTAIPFGLYTFRRPSWKDPNSDFEPFEWETKDRGRVPGVKIVPIVPAVRGA